MPVSLRIVLSGCFFLLVGGTMPLYAQDDAPAPEAVPELVVPDSSTPSADSATAADANQWRYQQHDGRWWYWLPSNRWVVWSDGRWVAPPAHAIESESVDSLQYEQHQTAPQHVAPAPYRSRFLEPRPRSWYYTGRIYDGPYYYYDDFYEPYGGARPYPYYPDPRPYARRPYPYGRPNYAQPGVGISIGGGSGIGIGIGF
jgi:hypothetical protein